MEIIHRRLFVLLCKKFVVPESTSYGSQVVVQEAVRNQRGSFVSLDQSTLCWDSVRPLPPPVLPHSVDAIIQILSHFIKFKHYT